MARNNDFDTLVVTNEDGNDATSTLRRYSGDPDWVPGSSAAWANIDQNSINIAATNIRNFANTALSFYADEKDKLSGLRMGFLPTSAAVLTLFDASSNDSILVGATLNSVYQFGLATQWSFTYYAIGGTGGPYISVQNFNTNGADPLGDFWKCSESGYRRQRIMSYDGVPFCVPYQVITYDYVFSKEFRDTFFDEGVGISNNFYEILSEIEMNRTGKDKNQVVQEYERRAIDLYGLTATEDSFRYGLIPKRSFQRGAMRFPAAAEYRREVLNVPWDFATLNLLTIGNNGRPKGLRRSGGVGGLTELADEQIVSFYEEYGLPGTGYDSETGELSTEIIIQPFYKYAESFLIQEYASSNIARESEYQVQYGELEARRLQYLYGDEGFDLGNMLNNIYMGTARYLASTFLQSVYTFKTVKMPAISPHTFAPPTLADAQSSADIAAYESTSTPFSPEYYYASSYGEMEGISSPLSAPTLSGFVTDDSAAGRLRAKDEMGATGPVIDEYDSTYTLDRPVGFMPSTTTGGSY
jgi:hypothetical protein